jgi:hypothetical protein
MYTLRSIENVAREIFQIIREKGVISLNHPLIIKYGTMAREIKNDL